MIIVDRALEQRAACGRPIRAAIVGAGFIGRGMVNQILGCMEGMDVVAIANRTISKAAQAYHDAGADNIIPADSVRRVEAALRRGQRVITDQAELLCEADGIDVILEATGDVEFGALVATKAIANGKHIVIANAELDATVGPLLKVKADQAGVVYSNCDGDQPGVVMNLIRFVRAIGYQAVLAGNIKGLLDHYRTPDTQAAFAAKYSQSRQMATSFADGTKIAMEMAVVANATGLRVGKRGMYGPACEHVNEAINLFPADQLLNGGLVDFVLGAEPGPGVFVIGHNDNPLKSHYMDYFKMGQGPFHVFYVPYHLPHLEMPLTAARAVLFHDPAIAPLAAPVCDVITLAKRDLKAGERLDGIGGFTAYGLLENSGLAQAGGMLPMGLTEDCQLQCDIAKDEVIRYDDVVMPENRLCQTLRQEQDEYFQVAPKMILSPSR